MAIKAFDVTRDGKSLYERVIVMRNYGVTVADILGALKGNRNAFRYWTERKFDGIAQSHTENIRDLRIMLLDMRFPNNTFGMAYGDDFTPYVVTENDTTESDDTTDSDDTTESDDTTDSVAELVTA